jgi:hypothetical protein
VLCDKTEAGRLKFAAFKMLYEGRRGCYASVRMSASGNKNN